MDKLTRYRTLIKQAMSDRAELMRSQPLPGEEVVCVLNDETDNYLLLRLGWVRGRRLNSVTLHIRLLQGCVSIEQDWTDDFVTDLIDSGVSRDDLVFAVTTPPEMHPHTEFAVA